jgi:hypothetical protein
MASNMRLTNQTLDVRTLGGVFGTGVLQGDAATGIAVNTTCQIFQDNLGAATTSNIVQTTADSNLFGGRIPNGEVYTLFGFQVQVREVVAATGLPVVSANAFYETALANIEMKIHMKGQEYVIGNLKPLPSGLGCNGMPMNGGRAVAPFRFPAELPIQLTGNDSWFVTMTAKRAILDGAGLNDLEIFIYCPASRGIPISQLSGA